MFFSFLESSKNVQQKVTLITNGTLKYFDFKLFIFYGHGKGVAFRKMQAGVATAQQIRNNNCEDGEDLHFNICERNKNKHREDILD